VGPTYRVYRSDGLVCCGHRVRVAVNLSPMQFKDPDLVGSITAILQETGLTPECLELELTEGIS